MRIDFPFSCVIGQEDLKLALLLMAIDPTIGGVLISGERGTAKSTTARGIAALLPAGSDGRAAPFVELPLGATEDRVTGSLNISKILQDGTTELRSGLLARASGGVLYVDEVNLLPDHIVDLLLDAAASGWVTVERDGVSAIEPARFVLVGTMNPDEGPLRPQFLDRFGLAVQVQGLRLPEARIEAIRQRLAFDEDPAKVAQAAAPQEQALRVGIVAARVRLAALRITDAQVATVASLAVEHHLDGIRGDLAVLKAARALAAWQGDREITDDHIRRAAEFALTHRMRAKLPQTSSRAASRATPATRSASEPAGSLEAPASDTLHATAPKVGSLRLQPAPPAAGPATMALATRLSDPEIVGRGQESSAEKRPIRALPFQQTGTLAITDTLVKATRRGVRSAGDGVALAAADLMQQERRGPGISHILFLVDASGSMASQRRLQLAKRVALGLLASCHQRRDRVGLMVFRAEGTDLVLPFTRHTALIEQALSEVPTGGRTPLARALLDAAELLRSRSPALLVMLTDGRANVGVGGDPWDDAIAACDVVAQAAAGTLVIDCEKGPIALGRADVVARELGADCVRLDDCDAAALTLRIRRRLESP